MDAQIARQGQQIEAVMAALVTVPGSKALGARLATEEAKLRQLEEERSALTDQWPYAPSRSRPTATGTEPPGPSTFRLSWAPESLKNRV